MSFPLFDRIRALFRSTNLYSHENLIQNQSDMDRVAPGTQSSGPPSIIDQTNLQINRMERYKDFDQMDEMGEISLSLDLYADEGTQIDPERKHSLLIRARDKDVEDSLESLFYDTLSIDNKLRPMFRYLCKYGDFASEIIPTVERNAVASIKPFNIFNFMRVETKFGDLVGFYFTEAGQTEPIFLHPWQVMHARLTSFESIYNPYGRSILDGARKDFRRLRLMEDAALIYRIVRAPEKRIFTIPVGNLPASEVPDYLRQVSDNYKKQRFYDPASGEVNWRYAPLIQEDDYWLPRRPDGAGPTIDRFPGAENLDQIQDIEYFKKKMISALKIPFDRVGIGQNAGGANDKSLASTSSEFAKAVQWIQREMSIALKKVALVHLALQGFSVDNMMNFDLTLTASSAIDELYRIETWNSRATVITNLLETNLFPSEWILEHFTDMTDDEIKQMQKLKAPKEGEEELPPIEAIPGLGEGYDVSLENKLLIELHNRQLSNKKPPQFQSSMLDMVSSGELDGLPMPSTKNNAIENGLLVENYIIEPNEDKDHKDAREENRQLLLEHSHVDPDIVVMAAEIEV